jgi:pSer/pThr/pTyr-binding forkhead associated (FHA) protein
VPLAALRVSTPDNDVTLPGDQPAVIGRSPESDVVVRHAKVSRRHVALEPTADGWTARDLSTNGIWHEGQRVGSVPIGRSPVRLRLGGAEGPELTLTAVGAAAVAGAPVDDDVDELATRLAPNTPGSPHQRHDDAPVATTAGPPPSWLIRVPTLIWLFAAAFAVGALIAVS